ncbi:MAG: hypothetical protein WBQ10_25255 [Terriglobales bacterium]
MAINPHSALRLRTSAAIFLLMFCAATEIDCAARSAKQLGTVLTGKFVARVDGPSVTGFGMNRESYVFEMFSPTGSQFVTLSNTFLIYQPHLPVRGLDYSKLYKLTAVRDVTCDDTLENISRRAVFAPHGQFVETKYSLTYAQNFPSTTLPWNSPLPCYVVAPVPPPGKILTETSPPPLPQ